MSQALRIAVVGANGRVGRQLIRVISNSAQCTLAAALVRSGSSLVGSDAGELAGIGRLGVPLQTDLAAVIEQIDVVIDFTQPAATLQHLALCQQHRKKMVIGTTGLTAEQQQQLQQAAKQIALVYAANFSIGVTVMLGLLKQAAASLAKRCDIEIIEAHHRHKVDAPSGTALAMGNAIAQVMQQPLADLAIYQRQGHTGERVAGSIGFATVRAGDIVGEHTALFADIGERLEISHKATDRIIFAQGAVTAANWLHHQVAGLYNMQDVLSIKA